MQIFDEDDFIKTFSDGEEKALLYQEVLDNPGKTSTELANILGVDRSKIRRMVEGGVPSALDH